MTSTIRPTGRTASRREIMEHTSPRSLRLMSVRDAADYYGVSPQTVRRMIQSGKLKCYRVGRQIRIDEADLIANITPQELTW